MMIGDMVYIPSETYIYQSGGEDATTKRFEKLKQPQSLLVIGEGSSFFEVLMCGTPWRVKKRDVYGIKKEVKGDCKVN